MNEYTITLEEIIALDTASRWEPPRRNILPDEDDDADLEEYWDYEELNFDD